MNNNVLEHIVIKIGLEIREILFIFSGKVNTVYLFNI